MLRVEVYQLRVRVCVCDKSGMLSSAHASLYRQGLRCVWGA